MAIPFRDVGKIQMAGEFHYNRLGRDILTCVKDKAISPDQICQLKNDFDLRSLDGAEKNQLLDVLTRLVGIDTRVLSGDRDSIEYDLKLDDKPEAKKPSGRMFMEAGTEARLLQSEYELSVEAYAKHAPGFMAGMNVHDGIILMNKIYEAVTDPLTQEHVFVSFDLEKWSPGLPIQNHIMCDKLWAEAFGAPELEKASLIFTSGNLHYIKQNIHHIMPKPGADFEGFAGKKPTLFHIGVMGYAVNLSFKSALICHGSLESSLLHG